MDVVYRFRSAEKLLDFKELERRQIYMARLDELNDPMEGYKDVVWRGDAVLWENLLRHYLLSMVWTASHCMLLSDDDFEAPTIPAHLTEADLPTDAFRSLCGSIYSDFFSRPNMSTLPVQLSALHQHPRRDGLLEPATASIQS